HRGLVRRSVALHPDRAHRHREPPRALAPYGRAAAPPQRRGRRQRRRPLARGGARGADVSEAKTERIVSFDGSELALHRIGEGRPVVLLHGLFSSAQMNWIRFGHAQKLAAARLEAIMPDLRAHGESAKPHEAEAYPAGVLVRDLEAIVAALELDEFDLVGFSLGARTAAGAVIAGVRPRRLVLAGMGLEGLAGWERRAAFFIDAIDRFEAIGQDDPAFMAVQFMKTMKVDRAAARLLLGAVDDIAAEDLAAVTMP